MTNHGFNYRETSRDIAEAIKIAAAVTLGVGMFAIFAVLIIQHGNF